jgi:hypothetical protein
MIGASDTRPGGRIDQNRPNNKPKFDCASQTLFVGGSQGCVFAS